MGGGDICLQAFFPVSFCFFLVDCLSHPLAKSDTLPCRSCEEAWNCHCSGFCSFQTKLAGRGEEKLNSCSVQPRPRARLSQKLNQTTSPATTHEASQTCGVLRQGVQQMSQSHQEVVTLHGLPVLRKAMLVLIALTLLHQKVAFDSPTMPRAQVASFVHLLSTQRLAGDPSMTRGFLHRLGRIRGQLFPGFFADHHMQHLPPPLSLPVAILDVVHPSETLLAVTPVLLPMMVALQWPEPADLFPHRR